MDETPPNKVLEYAKILYDTGRYEDSKQILSGFIKLSGENKKNLSKIILALCMAFNCNVMLANKQEVYPTFSQTRRAVDHLKENLDEEFKKLNFESAEKLQIDFKQILVYRGYLIHWSLFLLNSKDGIENYLHFIFDEKYFSLIESSFQYMMKYIIVFTIISKSKHYFDLLKSTLSLSNSDDDIFVKLFNSISIDFDWDTSYELVSQCIEYMKSDYFMADYVGLFKIKCNEVLIENYVLLNNSIDLK
jgi:hypothetical protein